MGSNWYTEGLEKNITNNGVEKERIQIPRDMTPKLRQSMNCDIGGKKSLFK